MRHIRIYSDFVRACTSIFAPKNGGLVVAVFSLQLVALYLVSCDERRLCLERCRLNWKHHSQLLLNEGQFRQYYRMSFRSFEKLVRMLGPSLRVDEAQSRRRTGTEPLSSVNKI
ncbi:hypothetical protein GN244_ATG01823 [Phytophthora infestans]|nr:hypothetical protein GN244_ATG01823 [Phytophthora infestans]